MGLRGNSGVCLRVGCPLSHQFQHRFQGNRGKEGQGEYFSLGGEAMCFELCGRVAFVPSHPAYLPYCTFHTFVCSVDVVGRLDFCDE